MIPETLTADAVLERGWRTHVIGILESTVRTADDQEAQIGEGEVRIGVIPEQGPERNMDVTTLAMMLDTTGEETVIIPVEALMAQIVILPLPH